LFVSDRLCMKAYLAFGSSGCFAFAPEHHWRTAFPKNPVPTLPPNPGYATVNYGVYGPIFTVLPRAHSAVTLQ